MWAGSAHLSGMIVGIFRHRPILHVVNDARGHEQEDILESCVHDIPAVASGCRARAECWMEADDLSGDVPGRDLQSGKVVAVLTSRKDEHLATVDVFSLERLRHGCEFVWLANEVPWCERLQTADEEPAQGIRPLRVDLRTVHGLESVIGVAVDRGGSLGFYPLRARSEAVPSLPAE